VGEAAVVGVTLGCDVRHMANRGTADCRGPRWTPRACMPKSDTSTGPSVPFTFWNSRS